MADDRRYVACGTGPMPRTGSSTTPRYACTGPAHTAFVSGHRRRHTEVLHETLQRGSRGDDAITIALAKTATRSTGSSWRRRRMRAASPRAVPRTGAMRTRPHRGGAGIPSTQSPACQPPLCPLYVPPKRARGVRSRISRSVFQSWWRTYQRSSSIRSAQGSVARPWI